MHCYFKRSVAAWMFGVVDFGLEKVTNVLAKVVGVEHASLYLFPGEEGTR